MTDIDFYIKAGRFLHMERAMIIGRRSGKIRRRRSRLPEKLTSIFPQPVMQNHRVVSDIVHLR
jgi:hypothetical protein